jgi:uncharacterized protein (TIGR00730 family)
MNILVFCSANDLADKYTNPTKELAKLIAENGHNLVWGGSDSGLMGVIANETQKAGGKIIGVSVESLDEFTHKNADEMTVAKSLPERKAIMMEKADAIIALVGGLGTLDEIAEVIELKKHGWLNKSFVIMDTENFYQGLKTQIQVMIDEGFITRPLEDFLHFTSSPKETIDYLTVK